MLVEVEGTPRGIGRVLRLLQAFLEFPIEHLALLGLRLHLLAEAGLALGGLRAQRAQRRAEVGHRALRRRRLVGDDGAQLGVDRELAVAARAHEREGAVVVRHDVITVARVDDGCTSGACSSTTSASTTSWPS